MKETGLEVFLNVSVNFPEINIVKYEYNNDLFVLEVALTREIDSVQKHNFDIKVQHYAKVLHTLNGNSPETLSIKYKSIGGLTFLRYYRDANTLSDKEIDLFMSLLQEEFYDCLLYDGSTVARSSFRNQIKNNLLKELGANLENTAYLYAYRDHGKLCMFNR